MSSFEVQPWRMQQVPTATNRLVTCSTPSTIRNRGISTLMGGPKEDRSSATSVLYYMYTNPGLCCMSDTSHTAVAISLLFQRRDKAPCNYLCVADIRDDRLILHHPLAQARGGPDCRLAAWGSRVLLHCRRTISPSTCCQENVETFDFWNKCPPSEWFDIYFDARIVIFVLCRWSIKSITGRLLEIVLTLLRFWRRENNISPELSRQPRFGTGSSATKTSKVRLSSQV